MMENGYLYDELPDKELLELIKEDNDKAFDAIYNRYWTYLTLYAAGQFNCMQKAEDVVQEIFMSFYTRRNIVRITVSLRAYLCQALKFKIINERRSQLVRATYQKAIHCNDVFVFKYGYYQTCEYKELANNINHSINSLPEKCRQAFLLSRGEELSYKNISGRLGISVSTVEKHIIKALKLIKGNLNPE